MRILMFLIGILIPTIFYAQLTEIKYSRAFKTGAFIHTTSYHTASENVIAPIMKRLHRVDIRGLEKTRIDLECMEDVGCALTMTPYFFLHVQDKVFYIFTGRKGPSKKERKKKPHGLMAQEIDPASGKCIGEAKILATIKEGFTIKSRIFVENDHDGNPNKIILTIHKKPDHRDDALNNEAFDVHIFNNKLELLKQGIIRMPHTEQKMDNGDFFVDKDNNLFLLAQVREDGKVDDYRKEGKDYFINFHYELLKLNLENSSVQIIKIELENKKITIDAPFIKNKQTSPYHLNKLIHATENKLLFNPPHVGNDGLIRLAGFYSDPKTGTGVFVFTINPRTMEVIQKWHTLPESLLNRYEKKGIELKENEENLISLKEIRILEDNSVLIIGEKLYHKWKKFTVNNEPSDIYDFQDLFIAKIDANGELLWTNRIPKRGGYFEVNGSVNSNVLNTEHLMIDENTAYFFGIDNSANLNIEEDKIPYKYSVGSHAYVIFKIDLKDGGFEKGVVLRPKKKDGKIISRIISVYPVSKDEIVLMRNTYDGTNTLIKVTINE
ncbi:hypothetical protein [Aureispira anguillae]|uniref:Uncharacterized protein n=1 Tax=Aureispira anguillae TaxID=2864201 RepID=A0A915VML7_9BACT|nr:hypothetical protein [Aureispira anguillae]BDS09700.1 hypothetical protein AsAng_0004040 [Aureispira anguillae]